MSDYFEMMELVKAQVAEIMRTATWEVSVWPTKPCYRAMKQYIIKSSVDYPGSPYQHYAIPVTIWDTHLEQQAYLEAIIEGMVKQWEQYLRHNLSPMRVQCS